MKKLTPRFIMIPVIIMIVSAFSSCKKDSKPVQADQHFDLDVVFHGSGSSAGNLKFRQDADTAKIIDLDVTVNSLTPNHQYLLQRAVDPANTVDGNCTSTTWLTLGKGLTAQSIITDNKGNDEEKLWRDVTAIAAGTKFDIHFQVVDALSSAVVLTSDCYQYTVR